MAGKQADIKVGVITNYDDKGIQQAKTGLAGFSSSIAEADGVGGKFKAGFGSVVDSVKANAGAMAIGAGASLVAFGAKAIGAFTGVAKKALDLSTSTGLAIEDASRWIGVGDDFEVGADALATGLGKVTKSLDDPKWKRYGIATRDASGAARDANDILLDTFDTLSQVTNKTEQARIGQELFGKGYQSLTPILGHTRAEYEKMLGAVEDGQVVTAEEAEKAEKMRLAQDQLGDAIHEVTLQIGQQLAGLAPLLVLVAKFIDLTGRAFGPGGISGGGIDALGDSLEEMRGEIEGAGLDFGRWEEQIISGEKSMDDLKAAIEETGYTTKDATTSTEGYSYAQQDLERSTREAEQAQRNSTNAVDGYSYAAKDAKDTTDRLAAAAAEAKRKSDAFAASLQNQRDKIDGLRSSARSAVDDQFAFRDATDEAKTKVDEMVDTLKHHKVSSDESKTAIDAAKDAALDASAKFATLNGAAIDSAGGIQRQIDSLTAQRDSLAPNSPLRLYLQEYIDALNLIPSSIDTDLRLHISQNAVNPGAPGYVPRNQPHIAEGGIVMDRPGGVQALIAEGGEPEAVIPLSKMGDLGGGGDVYNVTLNLHAGVGTDLMAMARVMVNALGYYDRQNATHIVTPVGR